MKYVRLSRSDGGVSIMGLVPQGINGVRIERIFEDAGEKVFVGPALQMASADFERGAYPSDWVVSFPRLADEIAKLPADQRDAIVSHAPIGHATIPTDRTYRNAFVLNGGAIEVSMPKARDLHRATLRRLRKDKFEPIERAQRTALVNGDRATAQALEAKLQELRDVTADPAIEAAKTPEELKAVLPAALRPLATAKDTSA